MGPYIIDEETQKRVREISPTRVYPMYGILELRQALLELEPNEVIFILPLRLISTELQKLAKGSSAEGTTEYPYLILFVSKSSQEPHTKVSQLEVQLAKELHHNEEAILGIGKDEGLYFFSEPTESLLVYPGKVTILKKPRRGNRTPVMELDDTVCGSIGDYLKKFGLSDNYINRGRVMDWVKATITGSEVAEVQVTAPFCLDDFIGYEWKSTRKNNTYAAFNHSKVGIIYGVRDMAKKIPGLNRDQAKQVYHKFDLAVPSTIYHQIPRNSTTKRPKRNKKREKPQVLEKDLSIYINRYSLKKYRKGVVISISSGDDLVLKNPDELMEHLRSSGEEINSTEVHELWDLVRGGPKHE